MLLLHLRANLLRMGFINEDLQSSYEQSPIYNACYYLDDNYHPIIQR